jgi:hypothetical protein
MRQFFEAYRDAPVLSTLSRELSWSANLHILSATRRPEEREFYLRMAIKKGWNVRELARQIGASAFERSVLGSPKLSTALRELHPDAAEDFKEVYSLEFLDLPDGHSEADLHGALLRNLGRFITHPLGLVRPWAQVVVAQQPASFAARFGMTRCRAPCQS